MPRYLLHGFKWPRIPIRTHIIVNDIDDASPDYLMQATTPPALRESFYQLFPSIMDRLPEIQFIEQYDPDGVTHCQPYAFVADTVIVGDSDQDLSQAQATCSVANKTWVAMVDLKEALGVADAELGWFVVYNGDPERADAGEDSEDEDDDDEVSAPGRKSKSGFLKRLFKKGRSGASSS